MKNKGFTLIELLAVIVVLGVISTTVTTIVFKYITSSKQQALEHQKELIVSAAKDWVTSNPKELDKYHLNNKYILISDLQEKGYLSKNEIKNSVTGKKLEGCVVVEYQTANKSYDFTFNDDKEKCDSLKKDSEENPKVPALNILLEKNSSDLYEENNYYVFKGANPNNYLEIDGKIWRIISIDKENLTLKIISTTSNSKEWNSNVEVTDLSFYKSTLKSNLEEDLNILTENVQKNIIKNSKWYNNDILNSQDKTFEAIRSLEKQSSLNLNVGLLSVSEYMEASSSENCINDYNACNENNYLYFKTNYWLINTSSKLTKVGDDGKIYEETDGGKPLNAYPVVVLSGSIQISGDGTDDNPYKIK